MSNINLIATANAQTSPTARRQAVAPAPRDNTPGMTLDLNFAAMSKRTGVSEQRLRMFARIKVPTFEETCVAFENVKIKNRLDKAEQWMDENPPQETNLDALEKTLQEHQNAR